RRGGPALPARGPGRPFRRGRADGRPARRTALVLATGAERGAVGGAGAARPAALAELDGHGRRSVVGRPHARAPSALRGGHSGTIALGLAAATLAFAVTWPVWLAPLPLPDPDRVVRLYEIEPPSPGAASSEGMPESRRQRLSTTLLGDLHAHAFRTVEAVSWVATPQRTWIRGGERQAVATLELSPEGLGILGIVPLLGRLPAAPQGGEATEILLSERFWRTAFGGDPDVV